jgi:hypothetical protein
MEDLEAMRCTALLAFLGILGCGPLAPCPEDRAPVVYRTGAMLRKYSVPEGTGVVVVYVDNCQEYVCRIFGVTGETDAELAALCRARQPKNQ